MYITVHQCSITIKPFNFYSFGMTAKVNCLWIARTRIHRLVRWIDGVDTEFPVSFASMSEEDKLCVVRTLGGLCDLLDRQGEPENREEIVSTMTNSKVL